MQLGEVVSTVPSKIHFNLAVGFNVEKEKYDNLNFQVWDLEGQTQIWQQDVKSRPYWRSYNSNTNAFIFVIDSSDIEEIDKVKEELFFILDKEELKNTPFVIMANKQVGIFLI